jgi:hypothetical protein
MTHYLIEFSQVILAGLCARLKVNVWQPQVTVALLLSGAHLASLLPGHLPRLQCWSSWPNIAHCLAIFVELDYNLDLCLGFRKMLGPFMAVVQGCENHALGGRRERAPSRKWIGM